MSSGPELLKISQRSGIEVYVSIEFLAACFLLTHFRAYLQGAVNCIQRVSFRRGIGSNNLGTGRGSRPNNPQMIIILGEKKY